MNRKTMIAVVLCMALALNLVALDAYAEGYGKGKGHHFDLEEKFSKKAHFILKNEEELGLSDRQVDQIKDLKINIKKDLIGKKAQLEILGLDIKAAMWNDPFNVNVVNKLIDQKYEIKKDKAKFLVGAYATLKGLLTEEQKEKMKGLFKKCKKEKKHGRMKGAKE